MSNPALPFFTKLAAGGGRFGWIGPALSGLGDAAYVGASGWLGANAAADPNDPVNSRLRGALFGAGAATAGVGMARFSPTFKGNMGRSLALKGGLTGAEMFGSTAMRNQLSQARLADVERAKLEAPAPPPATGGSTPAAAAPADQDSKTTLGLSPGTMLGMGALGAGGLWLLSKLMKENKSERVSPSAAPTATPATSPVAAEAGASPGVAPGPEGPAQQASGLGTLRVTLPTKRPGDQETTIEMPLEQIRLPNTIIQKLRRDTKRRLRTESAERTRTRVFLNPEAA